MIKEQSTNAQFITSTFKPELVEAADRHYGIVFRTHPGAPEINGGAGRGGVADGFSLNLLKQKLSRFYFQLYFLKFSEMDATHFPNWLNLCGWTTPPSGSQLLPVELYKTYS